MRADSFEIGFNARYLLDVCGQIAGESMELRFADPALAHPGARPHRRRRALCSDAAAGLGRTPLFAVSLGLDPRIGFPPADGIANRTLDPRVKPEGDGVK